MTSAEQARARWRGVLAPLATPFTEDGRLDLATLQANVQWLMDRGARRGNTVVLAVGSGGDFPMMNLEERMQAITAIASVVDGHLPIIAGVQSLDIRETIELCQLCESLDIDGVQISGPFYYDGRPDDVIAIHDSLEELATHNPLAAELVKMRYFGGFSLDEAADVLGIGRTTAYRLWIFARAWLRSQMDPERNSK